MSGLYIHIPFCHSKCSYCDFYSKPSLVEADRYVEALVKEWDVRKDELVEPVHTLYIGGGTPSILPADLLKKLINGLGVERMELVEFTVEANPEDVTKDWVRSLIDFRVDRISMGVQSLVDDELKIVGRRHTASQALQAIDTIRQGGIYNLSCDLIYGLPLQTLDSWNYSLTRLLSANLSHLSAYMLSYEKGTRLYAQRMTGKVVEASEDLVADMYYMLIGVAADKGFDHYEISNFGKPGFHSIHNSNYWNRTPYLGLGVSAHSFDGALRRYNPSDIRHYLASPCNAFIVEDYGLDSVHNDNVITSLRTSSGIDVSGFSRQELRALNRYVNNGIMMHIGGTRYRITEKGWLLADAVMTDFMRVDS